MRIVKSIKKSTSILLIVAMIMTSAGLHTLADSLDAVGEITNEEVVESNDDEEESGVVELGEAVESNDDEEENEVVESNDDEEENEVVESNDDEEKNEVVDEVDDAGEDAGSVGESNESPKTDEEKTEKANSGEEPEEDETTAVEDEGVVESIESPEETIASDSEVESTAGEEETTAEESEIIIEKINNIASSSDALFGDGVNSFTLTYNFNDKSHDGKGSTDVIIKNPENPPSETKVVTNGEFYGTFESHRIYREGYELLGWSFDREGEVIDQYDKVDLTEDKTIYARWQPKQYKFYITADILQNGVPGKELWERSIYFTFDENIMDTIKANGLTAHTKDTKPELYDCLEFIGWNFNGSDDHAIIKDTDTFTNPDLEKQGIGNEGYICAVYYNDKVHLTVNAGEYGYYLDDGAEDIEANRKKTIDLGYVKPGINLYEVDGFKEPIPYKNNRLEAWWAPFHDSRPLSITWDKNLLNVGTDSYYFIDIKEEMAQYWNYEFRAHYEEDRYPITLEAGGTFYAAVGNISNIASETGVFTDDADKYLYTNRLGETNGGGNRQRRTIYLLKGMTIEEGLKEAGFEPPVAYDRDFLGWQEGNHPDRLNGKYVDFNRADFSKIIVDKNMRFTAVWKKKPLNFVFKKGPNMYFDGDKDQKVEEIAFQFPARDITANGLVFIDSYEGSLYDCIDYRDPLIIDDKGERNDWDYEFVRWEDDEEFLYEKKKFSTIDSTGEEPKGWNPNINRYEGLECVRVVEGTDGKEYTFEDGEYFFVDKKGRKYSDPSYGGDLYREEPYVFSAVIQRIPMSVKMFSPFPVFQFDRHKQEIIVPSGVNLGSVDEYAGTSFSKYESQGYRFAGWYQIDHQSIDETLLKFSNIPDKHYAIPPVAIDDIEEYFDKGMPTIAGFSKPGLDTWFKYVQCTRTDDLNYAMGQWFKNIDGELRIDRDTAYCEDSLSNYRSKVQVKQTRALDIISLVTADLILDAGEGHFADNSNVKRIEDLLIDKITPIREYKGVGYEVPTPSDASKIFAGWRIVDEKGNAGRLFAEHEAISKTTRLLATYAPKTGTVNLTLKLHGAETYEEVRDEDNNITYNVVEMPDYVMTVPQGIKIGTIASDIPTFTRKGYDYDPYRVNQEGAWYHKYNKGTYSEVVRDDYELNVDTTIHLSWKKIRYSYSFIYEIDGKKTGYKSLLGDYGQPLNECEYYDKDSAIPRMFDFSNENQPVKGYKITAINFENGTEVASSSQIEGNMRCQLSVERLNTVITFDANGGELIGDSTLTVPYSTYYKDIKNIVPKASNSNLAFVGWKDDAGVQVTDDYRVAMSEFYTEDKVKEVKFTAEWTEKQFNLVLEAGEGKFADGSNTKTLENVPYWQILSNIKDYEEPTLEGKRLKEWEVMLTKQLSIEYTRDNHFGEFIHSIEEENKTIVLKALYVDKTITFSIKLTDPSNNLGAVTFANDPDITDKFLPVDYVPDFAKIWGSGKYRGGYASGNTWVQTVKEGMTFGQWFDYMYDLGWRYKADYGYALIGWKYEEPATAEAPRKNTSKMQDVDMTKPILNGQVFTAFLVKGNFTVKIDANGGRYEGVVDKVTDSGVTVTKESDTVMVYGNVPGGTAADKIDGIVMPKRQGYVLVGYSQHKISDKSLARNVFISGEQYLYAIWSEKNDQVVQPAIQKEENSRRNPGTGSTGSTGGSITQAEARPDVIQNASDPRTNLVADVGPKVAITDGSTKQFTQNVSEAVKQQSQAQVTQVLTSLGVSTDIANNTQVREAVAEVQAGMNIVEQYKALTNQFKENPSIAQTTTQISYYNISADQAYWHTDEKGNVTLEASFGWLQGGVKDVWQGVTNDQGQTGWYKFDANGYMQTGLVQDGAYTYYLSEERGAGYGQMVCNQTITIGGITMTFNSNGALVDMQYSEVAAVKAIQDAAVSALVGSQPEPAGPPPLPQATQETASFLSNQEVVPII